MYRDTISFVLIGIALLAPTAAHAAVVISEIAWMGTSASANAEWIELQNTENTDVNLSGWTLVATGGSPNITLTGVIGASGFYLLERTSDASVPAVSADQIYSGALANTGLTLLLKDQAGTVIDTVEGGADWKSIGGDNTTKQTPQRSGSTWTTAEPTPRAASVSGSPGGGGDGAIGTSTDPLTPQPSVGGSPVVTATPRNPIPRLYVDAGPGRFLTTQVESSFSAHAYDSDGSIRRDARFTWSFGDGAEEHGDEVTHTYEYPGTYTIAIHARAGESSVVSLLMAQVSDSNVVVSSASNDRITIQNVGETLLDLSSWQLRKGETSFVIPQYTTLMKGQEATFPASITKLSTSTSQLSLRFPNGVENAVVAVEPVQDILPAEVRVFEPPQVTAETMVQPIVPMVGIQKKETPRLPQVNISDISYVPSIVAPSATVVPAALGASAGSSVPGLLTSPWTLSFMGLLVAAASILVIL